MDCMLSRKVTQRIQNSLVLTIWPGRRLALAPTSSYPGLEARLVVLVSSEVGVEIISTATSCITV